ncbi:Growth hormone receptor [Gossypium australe]|uniref:Growth hormone receptor n=1 Tax=Gossypium australe TaxID=47621 RepID=A0A5B6V6E4_9ROSI|nr:Growth hormone receptor [Gossypium australe]
MNQKFGAAKQATGTPSLAWSCVVVIASLLAGASVVHNIYKPDLVITSLLLSFLSAQIFGASRYLDTLNVRWNAPNNFIKFLKLEMANISGSL